MDSLLNRFTAFLRSYPYSEDIDRIEKWPDGVQKADFLLRRRQVIVELKELKSDPSNKIQETLDKHQERPEFPIFYGEMELKKILKHLPDGNEIYRSIYRKVTRQVEGLVRSAEEQISDTRDHLNLPNSMGLLVVLNDTVDFLNPEIVAGRIIDLLIRKRSGRGNARGIDYVLHISETHSIGSKDQRGLPIIGIEGLTAFHYPWFDSFRKVLTQRWTDFNDADFSRLGEIPLDQMGLQSAKAPEAPTMVKRYEKWILDYNANPYLRSLSDEQLFEFGRTVILTLRPHFLKDGRKLSDQKVRQLLESFQHYMTESNYRGLDQRNMNVSPLT